MWPYLGLGLHFLRVVNYIINEAEKGEMYLRGISEVESTGLGDGMEKEGFWIHESEWCHCVLILSSFACIAMVDELSQACLCMSEFPYFSFYKTETILQFS